LVKKENDSLRYESGCLMEECERLHNIVKEAKFLRLNVLEWKGVSRSCLLLSRN
jgi:hypothetical protein